MQQLQEGRKPVDAADAVAAQIQMREILQGVQVLDTDQLSITAGALYIKVSDALQITFLGELLYERLCQVHDPEPGSFAVSSDRRLLHSRDWVIMAGPILERWGYTLYEISALIRFLGRRISSKGRHKLEQKHRGGI
jgi:hypothetical protein